MVRAVPPILWSPTPGRIERSWLTRYMRWLGERSGHSFDGYADLWEWSVSDLDGFWGSIWDFFQVRASAPYERVLGRREMPGAVWFPGARVNYSEHVFRDRVEDEVALRHATELRPLAELSWGQLRELTARIAAGLRDRGVAPGDRVVAYMPNVPEAIAGLLACASLGAVWSSCSPDFGVGAILDRFAQVSPKVLLAVDGYRYGGRDFDRRGVVAELIERIPSLEATVLLGHLDPDAQLDWTIGWQQFLGPVGSPLVFEQVPFEHPLWILYSSGTTGLPKAIVHSQGGMLIEQLKKQHLHLDAQADDRVFWFTTTGWMMWNFLVGVLLTPASVVLYDGNPAHPDMDVLWQLAADAGITCFGTSAAYLVQCMKAGVEPAAGRDLSALRSVGSTGSSLSDEAFEWVYGHLGAGTWLFSTSGGTDLCTAFIGGVPTLPVYRGELQARSLGANVQAYDPQGRPLIGAVGELVITEPMPSMPLQLWNDPDGARYRESYFETFRGVWRHGDWIEITDRGTAVIYGRSDATINRGGVRMGTSEIYRAVLALPEIQDALVVDVDGWMPLFVVLAEGATLDADLEQRIARRIRDQCSPRHVPNAVHQVPAVPRTISGKLLEVPVKRLLQGAAPDQVASRDSLANPAALDWFTSFATQRAAS